jgi:hypothetical protein
LPEDLFVERRLGDFLVLPDERLAAIIFFVAAFCAAVRLLLRLPLLPLLFFAVFFFLVTATLVGCSYLTIAVDGSRAVT